MQQRHLILPLAAPHKSGHAEEVGEPVVQRNEDLGIGGELGAYHQFALVEEFALAMSVLQHRAVARNHPATAAVGPCEDVGRCVGVEELEGARAEEQLGPGMLLHETVETAHGRRRLRVVEQYVGGEGLGSHKEHGSRTQAVVGQRSVEEVQQHGGLLGLAHRLELVVGVEVGLGYQHVQRPLGLLLVIVVDQP